MARVNEIRSDLLESAGRLGVRDPEREAYKVAKIISQMMRGGSGTTQAVDNISAFTHPSNFKSRMELLISGVEREYNRARFDSEKWRIMRALLLMGLALKDSADLWLNLQNRERHGDAALSNEEISGPVGKLLDLIDRLEAKDKGIAQSVIGFEKERLEMIMTPKSGKKGISLLSDKAMKADTSSIRAWIDYWSSFGKGSNLRKLTRTIGMEGVDYGVGVLYARYLWGANLVMMNPSLAILAIQDDIELNREIDRMVFSKGDRLSVGELVREGTSIAGLKAREALRAVWLLTGKGRISFQVQPSTYVTNDDLLRDVKALMKSFDEEALRYDEELFLDEVMAPQEIEERKGRTHVFFKVDGSRAATYGDIEELTLSQLERGEFSLVEGDTGGLIEAMLSGWEEEGTGRKVAANCNITVNGFVADVLPGALCQFRGHAKARRRGIPISHSIITRMGGRVEGLGIRWLAIKSIADRFRERAEEERKKGNLRRAEELASKADEVDSKIGKEFNHANNGELDKPEIRKLAKEAGFLLAEEAARDKSSPEEIIRAYQENSGNIFPTDDAIRIVAEAITKRSYQILEALKKCDKIRSQGIEEWETLLLQASMRPPYKGRYPHVVEIVAPKWTVAQGHFPNAAKDVEEFEGFVADPGAIDRPVDPVLLSQLENSPFGDRWRGAYEVNGNQVKIMKALGIYNPEWGSKGMRIEDFHRDPFPQHTLFNRVFPEDEIPRTKEENEAIEGGFIGDFNALGRDLLARNEREMAKKAELRAFAEAALRSGLFEGRTTPDDARSEIEVAISSSGDDALYRFDLGTLAVVDGRVYVAATGYERAIDPGTFRADRFSPVEQIIEFSPAELPCGDVNLSFEEEAVIEAAGRKLRVRIGKLDPENAAALDELK